MKPNLLAKKTLIAPASSSTLTLLCICTPTVLKDLDSKGHVLDRAKVNPMGGAIALGHPLGATGAIRAATVVHGLRRTGGKYGMVTMCIGTGQGAAGIFERVDSL